MAWDVLVLGASVDGLVAAATLARAGRRVLVVDQLQQPGGLCASEVIHPGYRHAGTWHDPRTPQSAVIDALDLARHGLVTRPAGRTAAVAPGHTAWVEDADLGELGTFVSRARPLLAAWMCAAPPLVLGPGSALALGKKGLALRRLGAADMLELLRIGPLCLHDLLRETGADPVVQAAVCVRALHGSWMGPRSPQSATLYLLADALRADEVVGGPAAFVRALVACCASGGVEIQCGARVTQITVESGRATGVVLADGTHLTAPHIVSTLGPHETLDDLVPVVQRDPREQERVRTIRTRGLFAKVHLALARRLAFHDVGRVDSAVVAADPMDVERSFDDAKYGRLPTRPVLDVRVPTVTEPELASDGHEVVSIATTATIELRSGWTPEARQTLGVRVLEQLAAVSDLSRDDIVGVQVVTPADIATRWSHRQGHPMHGELALDQLWALRPTPRLAQHRTALDGLWLAGTGGSPGLPGTGLSGLHAAQALLSER